MRCDQYIGLTKKAKTWIKENFKESQIGSYNMCHQAFNKDPLKGILIKDGDLIFKEVVQCSPWSSGPMYLTCIGAYKQDKLLGYMFTWKENPDIVYEYDEIAGEYYI